MDRPTVGWDGRDLRELLDLAAPAPGRFRARVVEDNNNGRVYGGQMLGQAVMAAARTVPAGRVATYLQFLFLSGARPEAPLDYEVTPLQDGKRFASRHVRGSQPGGRNICDASVSFATAIDSPAHMDPAPPDSGIDRDPERLPDPDNIRGPEVTAIQTTLGYQFRSHPAIAFRAPFPEDLFPPAPLKPRMRFWIKTRSLLPDDDATQAAAFAYLSDFWLNFAAAVAHVAPTARAGGRLYSASLNHVVWFHRPARADDWLLFDCSSPIAENGRGLSTGRVHDRAGALVASVAQESLLTPSA